MALNVITRKSSWLIKGTNRKPANYLLAALITIVTLTVPSFAQSTAITNGLTWLSSNQNLDGSFGAVVPARDTTEVADTLKYLDSTGIVYLNAVNWIDNDASSNNDYLARKINSLALYGRDVSILFISLASSQTTNGGWGLSSSHVVGNPLDTALALQALKSANYPDSTVINNAITYLISNQNTDGGFGFYAGDDSNVYMTSLVSWTLQQFQQTTSIATAVNKATNWIIGQQTVDGGWGSVYEAAHAYIALISVITDNTVLGNAVNYLTSTQLPNGSWNDDSYSTALAIRALYFSQNKPVPTPAPTAEITPVNENPSATETTVTGKVTDVTGSPIANADVSIAATNLSTKTDSTGQYTLTGINLLEFSIKTSAVGYNSLAYTITATSYGTYTVDFALSQSQASDLRIISLTTDKQSYSANENVLITATIENTGSTAINTIIEAQINDNQGSTVALATPANPNTTSEPFWVITVEPFSSVTVSIVWNTAQFKPGDYQINLKATVPVRHKDIYIPGDILAEQGLPMNIQPFVGVSNSAIKLTPTFTYLNAAETLTTNLSFANKSNISAELTIAWTIKSPSGVILNSGSVPVSLSLDTVSANIALTAFTYNFNETGEYPVDAVIYNNGNILASTGNKFTVLSNIRIEPSRSVSPQTVIPECTGKVKITIVLKGVEVK